MKWVSIAASFLLSVALPLNGELQIDNNALQEALNINRLKLNVLSWAPRIFLFENFLTDVECDYIIARARPELRRSTVIAHTGEQVVDETVRSQEMFFDNDGSDLIIKNIERRVSELAMRPIENGEQTHVVYYGKGDECCAHWDFFDDTGAGYYKDYGGQREVSVIMYLADTEAGGETEFPKIGIKVKPVKGNVLVFFNCTPDGENDPLTMHRGAPVIEGEKWIVTRWLRKEKISKRLPTLGSSSQEI